MNVVSNFFKSDKISPLHDDRVAEVAKRREVLAEKRQELVWAQQRKLEDFDGTEGKAVSDYEAAIAAFEGAPAIDPARFRDDVYAVLDQDPTPRG